MGNGWSVAYRTLDAQYFGVPQRRRRIYLVADFAGRSAGKVLFESEGLSGYSAESFRAWQRTACRSEESFGATGFDGYNGSVTGKVSSTLGVNCGMSTGRNGIVLNDQGGSRMDITDEVTATLRAEAHHPPCVMESAGFCTEHSAKSRSIGFEEEKSPTLRQESFRRQSRLKTTRQTAA
jgi:DNA (cytosine-5)-methyltransferase 1